MAPPSTKTASPAPGPSVRGDQNRVAEALYNWCRNNHDYGHVFGQDELLDAGIIPNRDLGTLLACVTHLVQNQLLRLHDRAGGTIGWELVDPGKAKIFSDLTRDERMVLSTIDAAGSSGIWTRTIKYKSSLPAHILDRVYKKLESKNLIKQLKHVKNPGRKFYIMSGLKPSEEAAGDGWYTDGALDVGLIDLISKIIEAHVSSQSWQVLDEDDIDDAPLSPTQKHKAPGDGFEDLGDDRAKASKTHDGQHKARKQTVTKYQPFPAGYRGYPTVREITAHITALKVSRTGLSENDIAKLLEVMVYDDRLFKMHRPRTGDEVPDDPTKDTITVFRCFKTPSKLREMANLEKRKISAHESVRKAAYRQQELEDIGTGGSSEVPCMRCPAFDICGDGGPVNVVTCKYFDQWYLKIAEMEKE